MIPIHIAVCDDEPYYLEELKRLALEYAAEKKTEIKVDTFTEAVNLVEKIRKHNERYHLLLLDVEMPGMSGVEAARILRRGGFEHAIGFITNYENYALHAFEVDAVGYVVKPIQYAAMKKLIDKAMIQIYYQMERETAENRFLEIIVKKEKVIIDTDKIFYLEKDRNRCIFHYREDTFVCYDTLSSIYKCLNHEKFMYVHQGYIVNFDKIKEVRKDVVCLGKDMEVPVSRKYHKAIKNRHMDKIYRLKRAQLEH